MQNPNLEANAGDILHGDNNKNFGGVRSHYIIYLGPVFRDRALFLGAMLTSSHGFNNISLKGSHFLPDDQHGQPF